jgi:TRAP-type C4-dicarboxylate transport system permease small subunit
MKLILGIVLFLLLILVLILGVGIGTGFLVHWIIPSIGVDIGTLIGVITIGWTVYFFLRLMRFASTLQEDEPEPERSDFETMVLKPIRLGRPSKRRKP